MKKRLLLLCASSGLIMTLTAQAPSAQDDQLLRQIDSHYNHLASLRARYVERYTGLGMERSEAGTLLLKKPGRMLWHYDQPAGKVFVLDGKYAWFYTPGDTQAQRLPAKQLDDLRTPLRFLLGHTQLKRELAGVTVSRLGGQLQVSGVPIGLENHVKELKLHVTPKGIIQAMRIEEIDGAVTEFTFTEIQENVSAKDEDFRFVVPEGVVVVNGTPAI